MTTTPAEVPATRAVIAAALDQPTLCHAFQVTAAAQPDGIAIRLADDSVAWTWREYRERVVAAAAGLAARGVGTGDAVALLLRNRAEVYVADAAAMHLGAIAFSIYHTNPPEQIVPLLENSGARLIVTEPHFLEVAEGTAALLPGVELVVVDGEGHRHETFDALCARPAPDGFDFDATWQAIDPDSIVTIVYTSGTTGTPKGVQHTHRGLLYGLRCMDDFRPVSPGGRVVSYLPMAHIAERFLSHYCSLVFGLQITCCPDPAQLGATLAAVHPTRFMGVPRIYEKFAAAVRAMAAAEPDGPLAAALAAPGAPGHEPVRAAVRAKLGFDEVEWCTVAAAPTPVEVLELFHALGVDLLEFWGMSECMFSTCNPPGAAKLGTVGTPVPGVEIKLADDGELLVRGRNVFVGYRHDPVQTAETIDPDGWMHSGDIAAVDEDGYYRIVDRKKELIINSAGKNMAPSKIETAIKAASPLIAQVVAIGDRRPYVTALIVLDEEAALAYARAHGLEERVAVVAADPAVRDEVAAAVAAGNERLARVEQVKRHAILPEAWQPGTEELTPTMKLRRRPIAEKYAAAIDALYAA